LIDAVHAAAPKADSFTGKIARAAAEMLEAHWIVATVSRKLADLNRPRGPTNSLAIDEYRTAIQMLLEEAELFTDGKLNRPFLHIAVHGMADREDYDVEIGTRYGKSCSNETKVLVYQALQEWARSRNFKPYPKIVADQIFVGDSSKTVHRCGDKVTGFPGYGPMFHTVQIEFAHWLRRQHRGDVVEALVLLGNRFAAAT